MILVPIVCQTKYRKTATALGNSCWEVVIHQPSLHRDSLVITTKAWNSPMPNVFERCTFSITVRCTDSLSASIQLFSNGYQQDAMILLHEMKAILIEVLN